MSDPTKPLDSDAAKSAFATAESWRARDGQVATATVIGTWGSAPVPVGGQMVVATNGEFHGSVSGGCVEGEVLAAAEDVLNSGRPETLTFGVSDETAWDAGLPCGGQIEVFVERLDRDSGDANWLDQAVAAQSERSGLVIETDLETAQKTLHVRGGDKAVPADIAQRFQTGKSELKTRDAGRRFYQAVLPPARVIVVGATHIAQLFAEFARMTGYAIHIVDPRTAFASAERFASVPLHADWPQDAIPAIGLDAYTAVVVVAHVSHIDDEALKLAVKSDCLYIGALGSRRNHEKRTARLLEAGCTQDEINRIACPIGLDIGAQTPAEIAIAILGEVILAVRGPKHRDPETGAPDVLRKHAI